MHKRHRIRSLIFIVGWISSWNLLPGGLWLSEIFFGGFFALEFFFSTRFLTLEKFLTRTVLGGDFLPLFKEFFRDPLGISEVAMWPRSLLCIAKNSRYFLKILGEEFFVISSPEFFLPRILLPKILHNFGHNFFPPHNSLLFKIFSGKILSLGFYPFENFLHKNTLINSLLANHACAIHKPPRSLTAALSILTTSCWVFFLK